MDLPPSTAGLERFGASGWDVSFSADEQARALDALEHGRLLFFPQLAFSLAAEEQRFLSPTWSDGRAKNISFDPASDRAKGATVKGPDAPILKTMLARYATVTRTLLEGLLPSYRPSLVQARTSFRPVGIGDRRSSYRKDDRLLHPDAFPSRPTRGVRILRVFTNVDPMGRPRVWRVGEPFDAFAQRFLPRVARPLPGLAWVLAALRITKGRRGRYDHVMLQLHDRVKQDRRYQQEAPQVTVEFPAGSTWVVFTDQVLHAAMAGHYLFEQTFHVPVAAQRWPDLAPLRVLERLSGRPL